MSVVRLRLGEWDEARPEDRAELRGLSFCADERVRRLAAGLRERQILEVEEHARGLAVRTTSFVGSVQLGPLELTVRPKIEARDLLSLLRYAYGLRKLEIVEQQHGAAIATSAFQDILLLQLAAEVRELLARGLHRDYRARAEELSSPRGRIDFGRFARSHAPDSATLPCRHHERALDCLPNRALLAGLRLGAGLTADRDLRRRLRFLAALLEEHVATQRLTAAFLRNLERLRDRRLNAYAPSLRLIRALAEGSGVTVDETTDTIPLPGFLFDMNRLFQAVLARFLAENLPGHEVRCEERIHGMIGYDPEHNPRNRRSPTPRPDFLVLRGGQVVSVLDAKYRDLWATTLPRDMLYQLAIYALSPLARGTATILYPTTASAARDQRVAIREPASRTTTATVRLRPVPMSALLELTTGTRSLAADREREALARTLAF